ncbi:carph-isopro domain-containing protein [Sphingobium sp.]|uniref:carph-isopro domain-containing protein n=1 Tax=Sphingobium sp. TaxID=1912891 RepID=UPI00338F74AF
MLRQNRRYASSKIQRKQRLFITGRLISGISAQRHIEGGSHAPHRQFGRGRCPQIPQFRVHASHTPTMRNFRTVLVCNLRLTFVRYFRTHCLMVTDKSIFQLFGGIRPMARALGEASSSVATWKRVGRIPAEKQPHVLAVGFKLSLPITAEHVVFPLGRPHAAYAVLPPMPAPVFCEQHTASQCAAADQSKI